MSLRFRPQAHATFYKAHGLGNDYLVVEEGDGWTLTSESVQKVCHRTRGVGSDGIVWVAGGGAPFDLRMFNPDGSEFERSGNGLRVVASWLFRSGRVGTEPFPVVVGGDRVEMQVLSAEGGLYDVVADMGACEVEPERILDVAGVGALRITPVSVGNPHAVVWGDPESWTSAPGGTALERIGPRLTAHPAFPGGTNVQLAFPDGPGRVRVGVWERGVGRTSASGTSACAVAAAAVATGRTSPGEVEVIMEGGSLHVRIDVRLRARLRGPVRAVCRGELEPGLVAGE